MPSMSTYIYSVSIRDIPISDVFEVFKDPIVQKYFGYDQDEVKEILSDWYFPSKNIESKAVISEAEKELILGVYRIEKFSDSTRSHNAFLELAVCSEYRGLGIGTKIIGHVESLLKDREIEYLYLEVHSDNIRALSCYHHLGYVESARISNWIRRNANEYVDKIFLRKKLT